MKHDYIVYDTEGRTKVMPKLTGLASARFCNILDIDGVIADNTHRLHHIIDSRGKKLADQDWDTYKSLSYKDAPITDVMEQLQRELLWVPSEVTIYLTGREESEVGLTIEWYNKYKHLWGTNACFMFRSDGDHRKSGEVKKEMLYQLFGLSYQPLVVVDDWQENIDMYSGVRGTRKLSYNIIHVKDKEIRVSIKRDGKREYSIKRSINCE